MNRIKVANLEVLLQFPGVSSGGGAAYGNTTGSPISDASVLTCGCLTSESIFRTNYKTWCPHCRKQNVLILAELKPLRELYKIIQQINLQINEQAPSTTRRRSSAKDHDLMDLIGLFYKYAKEEEHDDVAVDNSEVEPIDIGGKKQVLFLAGTPQSSYGITGSFGGSSFVSQTGFVNSSQQFSPFGDHNSPTYNHLLYENNLLRGLNEQQEFNFSKCFPFHRLLTTLPTQQIKFNLLASMLKIPLRFIGSSIYTLVDFSRGVEVTRFALITDKRWELYEYLSSSKPQLICCGKSNGEFGETFAALRQQEDSSGEIFNSNEFTDGLKLDVGIRKKLAQWDFINCQLSENYLVISGTRGVIRAFNIRRNSPPHTLGQAVYTYSTNFPIRCMAVSPNSSLIACGINARERLSGKEQPFIILHRMVVLGYTLQSVEPITITIPYRDPIKLISFNALSTHLLCGTIWESRYLVIKLRPNETSENYKKPRLIWSDATAKSKSKMRRSATITEGEESETLNESLGNILILGVEDPIETNKDLELMMSNEGITDLQFGVKHLNTIVITSCSLTSRPPFVVRLEGANLDAAKRGDTDNESISNSMTSFEEEEYSSIKSSEVILKISEVGSSIHKCASSPRGDGIVFLAKDGSVYLVSVPNFISGGSVAGRRNLGSDPNAVGGPRGPLGSSFKRVVVLLGEVANAERFTEAATVKFSPDGGKVFIVDRKGIFSVFDFTKGVPGEDPDVVKCKIITM